MAAGTDGEDTEWHPALRELLELSEADETQLLDHILTSGLDQGCFLRCGDERDCPPLTPTGIERLVGEAVQRECAPHPEGRAADPFEHRALEATLPEGHAPGLVILSQRCDLIKPIAAEPLVEVASASLVADPGKISEARKGAAYSLLLAEAGEDQAWVADLRTRGHIPKHWLAGEPACQPIPVGRPRRRFANRLGGRAARDAIPASVAADFQRPLRGWLYDSANRRALTAPFSELMLGRPTEDGSGWRLMALIGEGKDLEEATETFEQLVEVIAERVKPFQLDVEGSGAYTPDDISLAEYEDAFKLDFGNVTFGSRSEDHAEPIR